MLLAAKIIFLFMGIIFTFVNLWREFTQDDIPYHCLLLQAIGCIGFIILQCFF